MHSVVAGFSDGCTVKNNDVLFRVLKMCDDTGVTVQDITTNSKATKPHVIKFADFASNFTLTVHSIETLDAWQDKVPAKSGQYADLLARGYIQVAMAMVGSASGSPNIKIQTKPARAVFAQQATVSGKLVCVPETMKVLVAEDASKPLPTGALACTVPANVCGNRVYLLPTFSDKFAVPAWAIRSTENEDDANMEIQTKTVKITSAINKALTAVSIGVPVLVNKRRLAADDELLIFRPPIAKVTAKRGLSMSLQPMQKVAKHR